MRIQGRTALVTGGSSGLGAATAADLAERGATVVSIDVHPPTGGQIGTHRGITHIDGDVTVATDVQAAIDLACSKSHSGTLDVLVNCAGVGSNERISRRRRDGTAIPGDLEAFRRVIDINLIGTFNCMRLTASAMATLEDGSGEDTAGVIINTASIAAFDGQVGQAAYSASKAAIVAMTFVAARDLAPLAIRVNAIAPGLMETPLFATIRDDVREGLLESVVSPRRVGLPSEFARLAAHLIDNDYINGETIRLDAGARLPYRSTRNRT